MKQPKKLTRKQKIELAKQQEEARKEAASAKRPQAK